MPLRQKIDTTPDDGLKEVVSPLHVFDNVYPAACFHVKCKCIRLGIFQLDSMADPVTGHTLLAIMEAFVNSQR